MVYCNRKQFLKSNPQQKFSWTMADAKFFFIFSGIKEMCYKLVKVYISLGSKVSFKEIFYFIRFSFFELEPRKFFINTIFSLIFDYHYFARMYLSSWMKALRTWLRDLLDIEEN